MRTFFSAILLAAAAAAQAQDSPLVVGVAAERVLPFSTERLVGGYSLATGGQDPLFTAHPGLVLVLPVADAAAPVHRLALLRELPSVHLPVFEFQDAFGGIWKGQVRLDQRTVRLFPIHAGYAYPGAAEKEGKVVVLRNEEELGAALRDRLPSKGGQEPLFASRVLAAAAAETRVQAKAPDEEKKRQLEKRIREIKEELTEESNKRKAMPVIPPEVPAPLDGTKNP